MGYVGIEASGMIISGEMIMWIPPNTRPVILPKNYANFPGANGVTRIGIYLKGGK